jgi:proteic killer suppression protein
MSIVSFRHKGLRRFFETGVKTGIPPHFATKLALILDRLDAAHDPKDMNFPGSDFHALKGDYKGFYSVHVNGNWTIVFRFESGDAKDVDLVDYL